MYVHPFKKEFLLTEADMTFVASVLETGPQDYLSLVALLADPEEMPKILQDERIYHALLDRPESLDISLEFYFYIVVRRAFGHHGLNNGKLTEYVALVLAEYAARDGAVEPGAHPLPGYYGVDFLMEIQKAEDPYRCFSLYVTAGNQFLFLTGLFPRFLESRERRHGAPGLQFYEEFGRNAYRSARDHPLAQEFNVVDVYDRLVEDFSVARSSLNDLAERVLHFN